MVGGCVCGGVGVSPLPWQEQMTHQPRATGSRSWRAERESGGHLASHTPPPPPRQPPPDPPAGCLPSPCLAAPRSLCSPPTSPVPPLGRTQPARGGCRRLREGPGGGLSPKDRNEHKKLFIFTSRIKSEPVCLPTSLPGPCLAGGGALPPLAGMLGTQGDAGGSGAA